MKTPSLILTGVSSLNVHLTPEFDIITQITQDLQVIPITVSFNPKVRVRLQLLEWKHEGTLAVY